MAPAHEARCILACGNLSLSLSIDGPDFHQLVAGSGSLAVTPASSGTWTLNVVDNYKTIAVPS